MSPRAARSATEPSSAVRRAGRRRRSSRAQSGGRRPSWWNIHLARGRGEQCRPGEAATLAHLRSGGLLVECGGRYRALTSQVDVMRGPGHQFLQSNISLSAKGWSVRRQTSAAPRTTGGALSRSGGMHATLADRSPCTRGRITRGLPSSPSIASRSGMTMGCGASSSCTARAGRRLASPGRSSIGSAAPAR